METPNERRDRVSALVQEKWPGYLIRSRLLNTSLDIVRGKYQEFQSEEDRLEAVDALAEIQLELGWG